MKPNVRRGLGLLTIIAFVTVWMLTSGMAGRDLRVRTCTGKETLKVIVKDSVERRFVEKEDVENWLEQEYRAYAGLHLDSVDLARIEKILLGHSAVKTCQAWLTDDGSLHVELTQREPVLRFNETGNGYYCDADGFIFPLQSRFSVNVPDVEGNIPLSVPRGFKGTPGTDAEKKWLARMLALTKYMNAGAWKDNIRRIRIDKSGDVILFPLEGGEKFIFGEAVRLGEKFDLLDRYYTTIVPSVGTGYYSTIDLRYKGQLICRK